MNKELKKAIKKNGEFFEEFKKFALKSNVVDMAVGVIIGTAFGKIVSSLVNDILMPLIGLLLGGVNFTELKIGVSAESSINYGMFLQNVIDFFIIAFSVFIFIKVVTSLSKLGKKEESEEEKKEEKKTDDVLLLEEIRDLLKEKA